MKIKIGEDENEMTDNNGQSATQRCKSYVFHYRNHKIRIIDTPGIGDPRGIEQDQINFDNILCTISQLSYLHCVCILLKPNQQRLTVTFEHCIKMLFANIDKSASDNFAFIFTNTRGTYYLPDETGTLIKILLKNIKENPPHVTIPFGKDNMFCTDNEAFRLLVALNNGKIFI